MESPDRYESATAFVPGHPPMRTTWRGAITLVYMTPSTNRHTCSIRIGRGIVYSFGEIERLADVGLIAPLLSSDWPADDPDASVPFEGRDRPARLQPNTVKGNVD